MLKTFLHKIGFNFKTKSTHVKSVAPIREVDPEELATWLKEMKVGENLNKGGYTVYEDPSLVEDALPIEEKYRAEIISKHKLSTFSSGTHEYCL